jgi:hypothetical protein
MRSIQPEPDVDRGSARLVAAQIAPFGALDEIRPEDDLPSISARLGARLSQASRTVSNSGHGYPDSGEIVSLCIASARVNFRICREARSCRVQGVDLREPVV